MKIANSAPQNPSVVSPISGMMQSTEPAWQVSRFFPSVPNYQPSLQPSTCISSDPTPDAAEEHHRDSILEERRLRRMISNRESARRSRARKQRHLLELWSLVVLLRTENHSLINKLNHASERHGRVLQENVRLKGEISDLRQMVTDLQANSSYAILTNLEEIPGSTPHLRA